MKTFLLLGMAAAAFGQGPVRVVKQLTPERALLFEVTVPAKQGMMLKRLLPADLFYRLMRWTD